MPTYQYACTACDDRVEAVQSFTDAPLAQCTSCGGALRKVFSAVGVVFKGSGFYKTDSRSAATSGSKADSKSDGKSGSTGDSATPAASGDKAGSAPSAPAAAAPASTPASKTA